MKPMDDLGSRRAIPGVSTLLANRGGDPPHPGSTPQSHSASTGGASPSPLRHLTQVDLARRWRMSERTLEAWRWRRTGPPHLRIGGKVIYRLDDVLAFEQAHLRLADV